LVAELELRNDTFLNCNSFSQFLLPRLFRECGGFVRDMVAACRRNRDCLEADLLPHLPTGMRLILPRGGIHCLLSFSAYSGFDDEALALALLEHHGLYLHPGYLYGVEESPCLVLSILKHPELFALAVAKLAQALNELL
jgi:DNA-binding transcriptional MocR family regulator